MAAKKVVVKKKVVKRGAPKAKATKKSTAGKKTVAKPASKPRAKASPAAKPARKPPAKRRAASVPRASTARTRALSRLATANQPHLLATVAAPAGLAQDQVIRFFNVPDGSRVQLRVEVEGNVVLAAELLEADEILARFEDAAVRTGQVRFIVHSPDIDTLVLTVTFIGTGTVRGEVVVASPIDTNKSKTFELAGEAGEVEQVTITIVTNA